MKQQQVILANAAFANMQFDIIDMQELDEGKRGTITATIEVLDRTGCSIQCLEYDRHGVCVTASHQGEFDILEVLE